MYRSDYQDNSTQYKRRYKIECCELLMGEVFNGVVNSDFRVRDASLLTLGTLLECEDLNQALIVSSTELALNLLATDPVLLIKDTSSWLLCRILEFQFINVSESFYENIIRLLLASLSLVKKKLILKG